MKFVEKNSYKYLVGMCIALFASPSFSQDIPSSLERVEPIVSEISLDSFSIATKGTSHSWVQLAWDRKKRHIRRVVFSSYDPLGDKKYDLSWVMEDGTVQADGPISGTGTLVWRKSSSKISGSSSIIATHIGSFEKGYASGKGHFIHASGFEYEGTWKDGIPHGQGRLYFANGDEYTGQFINGQPHGFGTYVDASGSVYDGGFGGGKREGTGTIYIPGKVAMTALWKEGVQLPGTSRQLIENERRFPIILANERYDEADDIEISIISDAAWARRKNEDGSSLGIYSAKSVGEKLKLFIQSEYVQKFYYSDKEVIIGNIADGGIPYSNSVPIKISFRNNGEKTIGIKSAYISVKRSIVDYRPIARVIDPSQFAYESCSPTIFSPIIEVQNFGWANRYKALLKYKIKGTDITGSEEIKNFTQKITTIDLEDILTSGGMKTNILSNFLECNNSKKECFDAIKSQGVYGKFENIIKRPPSSEVAFLPIYGTLNVFAGRNKYKYNYNINLPVGSLRREVECADAGFIDIHRTRPFKFKLNKKNYKLSLPIKDSVKPHISAIWRVELSADKLSLHNFRFIFELDDGRRVASRPIELEYFKPKL